MGYQLKYGFSEKGDTNSNMTTSRSWFSRLRLWNEYYSTFRLYLLLFPFDLKVRNVPMAQWLRRASQAHDMYHPWSGGCEFEPHLSRTLGYIVFLSKTHLNQNLNCQCISLRVHAWSPQGGRTFPLRSVVTKWLRRTSQGHEIYSPWIGGCEFEPKFVVRSTSV